MATTADLEGHICRATTAADRLFEALEEIEQAEVLARLRSARDQLEAALRSGRPRPGRRHINSR